MKILPKIEASEVPPPTKYGAIRNETLRLKRQQVLPIRFDSDNECRKAYESMIQWRNRNSYYDFTIRKQRETLYIERTA